MKQYNETSYIDKQLLLEYSRWSKSSCSTALKLDRLKSIMNRLQDRGIAHLV